MAKGHRDQKIEAADVAPASDEAVPEIQSPPSVAIGPVPPTPATASPADELCTALSDLIAYVVKIGPSTAPAVTAVQAALAKYGR